MRKYTILLAAAPLAMLAACGDDAEEPVEPADTEMTDTDTAASEYTPGPATSLADAGDYSGTYSYTGEDGATRNVTLNSADSTYSYTDAEGAEQSGTYTLADDGYRFRIDSYYGGPGWFTIRDGWLVRMSDDSEVTADTVVTGESYVRDDGAMFSREPEPGSPVVPDDLTD